MACGDVIRIVLEEPCRTIMAGMYLRRWTKYWLAPERTVIGDLMYYDCSVSDLYAKYNCTYCQEDISGLRVRCVECPDFDLCLQVSEWTLVSRSRVHVSFLPRSFPSPRPVPSVTSSSILLALLDFACWDSFF